MGPHDSDPPPQRLSGDPPGTADDVPAEQRQDHQHGIAARLQGIARTFALRFVLQPDYRSDGSRVGPADREREGAGGRGKLGSFPDKIGKEKLERLMANPNPNPKNRFKKGHVGVAGPGRPRGSTNILTRDIKSLPPPKAGPTSNARLSSPCWPGGPPGSRSPPTAARTPAPARSDALRS